jgi:hypothetical protein
MQIPIDFLNASLWIAATSIILLITTHLISAYDGPATVCIEKKKLWNATLVFGILFLVTVAIRIYG